MQEASGRSCRTSRHRPEDAVGIYLPALSQDGYILLPNKKSSALLSIRVGFTWSGRDEPLESEGRAIRVARVVVVDIAVVVDIHKVGRVAAIRR